MLADKRFAGYGTTAAPKRHLSKTAAGFDDDDDDDGGAMTAADAAGAPDKQPPPPGGGFAVDDCIERLCARSRRFQYVAALIMGIANASPCQTHTRAVIAHLAQQQKE